MRSNLCNTSLSIWLLFFFYSLSDVNGASENITTNDVLSQKSDPQSKLPPRSVHGFPTECGRQHYQPVKNPPPPPLRPEVEHLIGGVDAYPNSWPWQVMLRSTSGTWCGGTLIDTHHVLTAAHCFEQSLIPSQYKIYVGMHDTDKPTSKEQEIAAHSISLHEQFNKKTLENDLAIIHLAKRVRISDKINVICLPGPEANKPNEIVWVVGWGAEKFKGQGSRLLKQTSLRIMPHRCDKIFDEFHERKQICAGVDGGERSACNGDSGGPLMYEKDGVWYLNGVVSYGHKCNFNGDPGAFTRVSYYLPWIRRKTKAFPRRQYS